MQTVEPFSAQVFNDTMLQVSSRFDNSQVTGAYFIQTIGLFARLGDGDPVLFEVAQAITPDEMPAQSAVAPSAFVYNMQVTIQQASQLTVTVNPAGTATVQDILTLNATKVDIDGGDISNTIAATFEASNASWPIPAAGETIKVILGKIKKHLEDLASWRPTVSLISDIVNNLTSTATDKPLAANQGRVLKESVDQLNSENAYRFPTVSRFVNSLYSLHITLKKGMDRIVVGVFASNSVVSFAFIDWSQATGELTAPHTMNLGESSVNIYVIAVDASSDLYRIKIGYDSNIGRGITVAVFDTNAEVTVVSVLEDT